MLQKETVTVDLDAKRLSLEFLDEILKPLRITNVAVRLWDGTVWPDTHPRPVTLALNHPGALPSMFAAGTELALAEAYLFDDFDIEGDIGSVFDLADALANSTSGWGAKLNAAGKLLRLPKHEAAHTTVRQAASLQGKVHSIARDRIAVTYHYDVPGDFFQLFLDQRMVYSCAYFKTPELSLDEAQTAKLEHICRKLRLQPGQRLLDIGCGWGGLAMYAAEKYDVHVQGITLSQPQAEFANQRIQAAGLESRCRVNVLDYRELDETQPYDALVSVGMFEHVGAALLPVYFNKAVSLLKPGGVFLNHGIASRLNAGPDKRGTFSDTYVFPDGELEPISESLRAAEAANLEVRDV
jgi:cyclopropane-fatty-acyl-phospholipid synthase